MSQSKNDMHTVGEYAEDVEWDTPLKGKLRIMPVSDSPWAPTGFGTNTKNIGCILYNEGHHIGYAGCQTPRHGKWKTPWPLDQKDKKATFELLPIMYMGQERFGEESFPHWLKDFKPDLVLGHLDFQMFKHITDMKSPQMMQFPMYHPETGKMFNRKERLKMMNDAFKQMAKGQPWKFACIIPYDGEPSIPHWQQQMDNIDYGVAMSRYGQIGLEKDFGKATTYIPHGVDTDLFKPIMKPMYGNISKPNAFIVGCVARNQHRKNLPR